MRELEEVGDCGEGGGGGGGGGGRMGEYGSAVQEVQMARLTWRGTGGKGELYRSGGSDCGAHLGQKGDQ